MTKFLKRNPEAGSVLNDWIPARYTLRLVRNVNSLSEVQSFKTDPASGFLFRNLVMKMQL